MIYESIRADWLVQQIAVLAVAPINADGTALPPDRRCIPL
jgi:hypothetical protein